MEIGYALSSEEHRPLDLVRYARMAEEAGFTHALISDHFHPWTHRQGQGGFVWSVLGAIAGATRTLRVGTGVTAPIIRIHPAIVAQAAATVGAMMPGRFMLGVGTGENLNEHVVGEGWPAPDQRLAMLEEAIEVIRTLWEGDTITFRGDFYAVENARVFTLPEKPVPLLVAAGKPLAARLAGRVGDGLVSVSPDTEVVEAFREAGGRGKPTYAQVTVCWAATGEEARRTALEWWPNGAVGGDLSQELPLMEHFEAAAQRVTEETMGETFPCGPDPEEHLESIRLYAEAGFDHVYVHQVGPDQEGFFRFYEREVIPRLGSLAGVA